LLSIDTFERVLAEFKRYIFLVHLWVWGEPLLNKGLWRMVELAEAAGVGTEVNTNFSLQLNDEQIDRIIQSELSWLIVSADGTRQAIYERYRRGGNLEVVLSNMRRVVRRKKELSSRTPFVEWQFVPLKHNESDMGDAWELAKELGIDGLRFKPSRLDKTRDLSFSGAEIPESVVSEWKPSDAALSNFIDKDRDYFMDYHCPLLWGYATILADGGIAPCCETYKTEHDLGQFQEGAFSDMWNSAAYKRLREIALGRRHSEDDRRFPCYGCRVFKKPELRRGGSAG
jgi:radical SAM protein with 4Fe4S-binding SPASM domain